MRLLRSAADRPDAGAQPGRLAHPPGDAARLEGAGPGALHRHHPLHGVGLPGGRAGAARGEARLPADQLRARRSPRRAAAAAARRRARRRRDRQHAVRRRRPAARPARQAAARLGGRHRLHQLGPGAAEVRAQPSGGDLRHPRHAPARAHGRQRPGRLRRGAAAAPSGTTRPRRSSAEPARPRRASGGGGVAAGARQADDELASPAALRAHGADAAAVRLGQRAHDRQADARAPTPRAAPGCRWRTGRRCRRGPRARCRGPRRRR